MVNVVYAAPRTPPPVPPKLWDRMGLEWVGWDGSVWSLSDWRSGVFLTKDGVEGLSRPPHTDWLAPLSPSLHGQEFTGYVVNARPVFWPVYLYSDSSADDWRRLDAAFWKTMDPGKYGTWRVSTTGGTRELRCRFQDDGGHSYEMDPHAFGWQRYGISLIADDPFWTGEPVTQHWGTEAGVDFYGGATKAPLFHIGSASVISKAKMHNPGDREAWPVWTVKGPTSLVALGANGKQVTAPFPIAAGQTLTIDTDPRDQTAWLNGVDVTDQLGKYDFAPIPAGAEVPLSLSMTGSGVVTATITPRFDRAW